MAEQQRRPDRHLIPFGTQYEYCESYNDFGHNDDNAAFFRQMDFLTPELLRILQPGRLLACTSRTASCSATSRAWASRRSSPSTPTASPTTGATASPDGGAAHRDRRRAGEQPDLPPRLFRDAEGRDEDGRRLAGVRPLLPQAQTDLSRGYADVPVTKRLDEYSLARWQVDAAAYWRSSGDRFLTAEELAALPPKMLQRAFRRAVGRRGLRPRGARRLAEALAAAGPCRRPSPPCTLGAQRHVWTDILRMNTLNADQSPRRP
jgi:hypothetical protein